MTRSRHSPSAVLVCACLLAGLVVSGMARAQDQTSALDAVLEKYRAVEDLDEARRAPVIATLGAFDDAKVTRILTDELERASTSVHQEAVLKALARRSRPRAVGEIADVLLGLRTSDRVRQLAASTLPAHGNRAIDLLRDVLMDPPDSVPLGARSGLRRASLQALADANDDRAWRALAAISTEGSPSERLQAIRLMVKAPASRQIVRARSDAVDSDNALLAATALVQIVDSGEGNLRRVVENTWERVGVGNNNDQVRALFIQAMSRVAHRGLFDDLLQASSKGGRAVNRAIKAAAPVATENREFVRFLVQEGMEGSLDDRQAAERWLAGADPALAREELAELRADLGTVTRDELGLVSILHPVFKGDPTWVEDLRRIADSSAWELRTLGLSLLADVEDPESLELAQRSLNDSDWQVRSAAYEFCAVVRDVDTIPRLIGRLDQEEGRLKEELLDCLQDHTGFRFLSTARWRRFWRESGEGFSLPPVRKRNRSSTAQAGGGDTKGFFNIPVVSSRVAFLIDISGSMRGRIGTGGNRTRLTEAKRQLNIALDGLSSDRRFNVIVYDTGVRSMHDRLTRATDATKRETKIKVDNLKPRSATNIYGALELAFDDPDVDTIFLLTDGQPSAGRITDQNELADEIARWNLTRRIVIHTISIGSRSRLMQRLADESGGSFVHVR